MSMILIAEDSPTQAFHFKKLLEKENHTVLLAVNATEAIKAINQQQPDLLLTDLNMPGMNGIQLIEACSRAFPQLPAILMTDFGSEDVAAEALRKGAVSYVPKRRVEQDLIPTIESVLGYLRADRRNAALIACCTQLDTRFVLPNEPELVPPMVAHIRDILATMRLCEEKILMRLTIALTEAIDNALHHGNLELSSKLREGDGAPWRELGAIRRASSPYRERRIDITVNVNRERARIVIRDEGPGFDVSKLPDPTDPSHLEAETGRGVFLMRCFMDEVTYNAKGNELTLVKNRQI